MKYLITYWYGKRKNFHYEIVDSVEAWVEKMQVYDEDYVLINVLQITTEFAEKWDGALCTM